MKILFLYPNEVTVTRMPLGIAYLSSHLKRDGHKVKVFDTTFIKCTDTKGDDDLRESSLQVKNPDLKAYGLKEEVKDAFDEFEREINSFKPDVICMSAADPNYPFGLKFLRRAKKNHGNLITIVGGPTPTFAPEEVIAEDCIDIISIGEAEDAMCELCNKIEKGEDIKNIKNMWVKEKGEVYRNGVRPLQDINELLPPDLEVLDKRHFIRPLGGKVYRMLTVIWTRGCLFHCNYCANSALTNMYKDKGEYYRIKKPELIIKEMKDCKEKYNINFFFFVDDIFPLHKPEIIDEFCKLYKEHIDLPFSINLQPTLVKEEQLAKLVDAGCCNICVGLESGTPEVREKVLGRFYKNDQIVNVFNLARKYGIRSSSFNMIGLPHETRENIFDTIELNKKANPTSATLTFFHPYRGCALRNLCIKEKLYNPDKEDNYENVYRSESHLSLPQISKEELRGLFKTFQLYFKLPKEYYGLIEVAEGDSFAAKEVYSKILKPAFDSITKKESEWDFTKKV